MSQLVNDKIRLLRQDIRALETTAKEARRKGQEAFLTPEAVARFNQEATDAEALVTKKQAEIEAIANSIQLDLFKQP